MLALAGPAGVARGGEMLRLEQSAEAMGSSYSIAVYGESQTAMENAVEQAFDEVRRLDEELSNYKPSSDWSRINRLAGDRAVEVPADLFGLLRACVEYSRASEGAFDITVGPLMKVWGFYKGTGHLPGKSEIETARASVGYQNLELDDSRNTVRFRKKGVEIDPGGIGKGYAVDRMVSVLKQNGIRIGLVSASGSSIYAIGAPPGEDGWHITIKDPKDSSRSSVEVVLKDESMSTSGNYEKFFEADGRIYSHIMDPRTGYPAQGTLSASVIAPRTLDSEAWTKPVFINGRRWAEKHLPREMKAYICEDKPETPCAWLP